MRRRRVRNIQGQQRFITGDRPWEITEMERRWGRMWVSICLETVRQHRQNLAQQSV